MQSTQSLAPMPYNLKPTPDGSEFYSRLREFADLFLHHTLAKWGAIVEEHALMQVSSGATERSPGEYLMELLTFGVLRKEYGALAQQTPESWIKRLSELWKIRSGTPEDKELADKERAQLFHQILAMESTQESNSDEQLIRWLMATGEFVQEAIRMQTWMNVADVYWSRSALREASSEIAEWFLPQAKHYLSAWTTGVNDFVRSVRSKTNIREDLLLITRSEPVYHLNMLGSEVMNRGFAPEFHSRSNTILLVPGCMRSPKDSLCKAQESRYEVRCSHCNQDCEVSQLEHVGKIRGFRVFIVPHASSFTAWLKHWQGEPDTALIAVACPLHLVPGGYEMRALNLSAQCLLLQYSGCKRHWSNEGVPTQLDRKQLFSLLADKQKSRT